MQYAGNLFSVFFTGAPVRDFAAAQAAQTWRYKPFFHAMLDAGVYLPPSAFEAWFVNSAMDDAALHASRTRCRQPRGPPLQPPPERYCTPALITAANAPPRRPHRRPDDVALGRAIPQPGIEVGGRAGHRERGGPPSLRAGSGTARRRNSCPSSGLSRSTVPPEPPLASGVGPREPAHRAV